MTPEEKDRAYEINALLMAFHYGDAKALNSVVDDSDDPGALLMGGIAVLKQMIDSLLQVIELNVDEMEIDFETMVRIRGEYISDMETE